MVYSDSGIFNGISLVLCPQPQGQGHFFEGAGCQFGRDYLCVGRQEKHAPTTSLNACLTTPAFLLFSFNWQLWDRLGTDLGN